LLSRDADPAVRVEAALAQSTSADICSSLVDALNHGAALDAHLRYEAAWHIAKHADADTFAKLLTSPDEGVRLSGLIAINVACFEDFPTRSIALAALGKALENPGKLDAALLLALVQLDGDKSVLPALEKLIGRDDLPVSVTARALLVLRAKAGGFSKTL